MLTALLMLLVFVSAVAWDFAIANYNLALKDLKGHAAGLWSIAAYIVGAIGFVLAVKVTLWIMVPEAIGMYIGTRLAIWGKKRLIAKQARIVVIDNSDEEIRRVLSEMS